MDPQVKAYTTELREEQEQDCDFRLVSTCPQQYNINTYNLQSWYKWETFGVYGIFHIFHGIELTNPIDMIFGRV